MGLTLSTLCLVTFFILTHIYDFIYLLDMVLRRYSTNIGQVIFKLACLFIYHNNSRKVFKTEFPIFNLDIILEECVLVHKIVGLEEVCFHGKVLGFLTYCQAQAQAQALRLSGSQALRLRLRLSDSGSVDSEPGLTLKSCRPPTTTHHPPPPTTHYPPPTFKHEGRVPHKNPKSKTDLE